MNLDLKTRNVKPDDLKALACFLFIAALCVTLTSVTTPQWYQTLGDTDSYTRLTRVWHFTETQNWFSNHFPYYNTPWGIELHWTKPLDVCLLISTALLKPFLSTKEALYYGSFIWNPLFLFGAAYALAWGSYPHLGRTGALFVGLLVVMQPSLFSNSAPNRIDHHILEVFLQCLALGLCMREPLRAKALGIVLALGIWITIEFGLFTSILLATLYWIRPLLELKKILLWLAISLSCFMFLERGPDSFNHTDLQRLSLVHVFIAWVSYASLWIRAKPQFLVSGGTVLLAIAVYFFAFDIQVQILDPRIKGAWFDLVDEVRPAFLKGQFDYSILIVTVGAFVGIISILRSLFCALLAPGLIVYLILTFYQRRHGYYLAPYVAASLGFLGSRILANYEKTKPIKTAGGLIGLMILPLATTIILWPILPDKPKQTTAILSLVQAVSSIVKPGDRLFIWPDMESVALVWHLSVGTVYAPYHQNVEGILDSIQFRRTSDEKALENILKRRGISYVLIPSSENRHTSNPGFDVCLFLELGIIPATDKPELLRKKVPLLLKAIDLPQEGEGYLLFKVTSKVPAHNKNINP